MRPEKISLIFQNFQIYPIFCFLEGCVTVYEKVAQQHRPTEIKTIKIVNHYWLNWQPLFALNSKLKWL